MFLTWRTAYGLEHMASRFPDKLFYRIGDVAEITGVKPHVLRYWETEFSGLHPRKTRAGQRIYERRDVELVLEIKKLLYEQRYTISGARRLLTRQNQRLAKQAGPHRAKGELSAALKVCREELQDLLVLLQYEHHTHSTKKRAESHAQTQGSCVARDRSH
jgi:DNA-binding transcriptional MerR regulator